MITTLITFFPSKLYYVTWHYYSLKVKGTTLTQLVKQLTYTIPMLNSQMSSQTLGLLSFASSSSNCAFF